MKLPANHSSCNSPQTKPIHPKIIYFNSSHSTAFALVVSRQRLSLLVLFPIAVLVFLAGFSAGVAQGGSIRRIGRILDVIKVPEDRIRDLGSFFSDLDS